MVLCLGALGPLFLAGPAAAAPAASSGVAVRGQVPDIPSDVTRLGAVPGAQTVRADVTLAGQDPSGLAEEVAAISTPGSPLYHHYLTSAQFAAAYGPSPLEVQSVSSTLQSLGLTVGTPTLGSNLLPVSGTAHTVSAAFGTPLEAIRLPGRISSLVNLDVPRVPADLAGAVTGVVGLSGFSEEHSLLRQDLRHAHLIITSSGSTASATSATSAPSLDPQACPDATAAAADGQGYTSTQLAGDYGLSQLFAQGRTGVGQTIAVIEFEQFSESDIAAFQACYGLSNPISTTTVDGSPSGPGSGSGEAALDIEMAAVSAPSASIIVYEAPNETTDGTALDIYNRIASDDLAQVITTSWVRGRGEHHFRAHGRPGTDHGGRVGRRRIRGLLQRAPKPELDPAGGRRPGQSA